MSKSAVKGVFHKHKKGKHHRARADGEEIGEGEEFPILKVHIRPGQPFYEDCSKCLLGVPEIEAKPEDYTPMPYTFRVPYGTKHSRVTNVVARSPPFYLLLDHTIAVVWEIFTTKEFDAPLGIAQLQWALLFLKTIVNRQGDNPKDIRLCVDIIEDLLVDEYALLNDEVQKLNKLDECTEFFDGAFGPASSVSKEIPFSVNYMEMTNKVPVSMVKQFEDRVKQSSMSPEELEKEIENIKRVTDLTEPDYETKNKAINFLNIYKDGQVDKIRTELRKLKSIEDLLKSMGVNYIENYVDDEAADKLFK